MYNDYASELLNPEGKYNIIRSDKSQSTGDGVCKITAVRRDLL